MTVTFVFLLGIGSVGWAADVRLAIGTASTGGTWYPLGGGVGAMINKYVKGYQAAAHPSGASIENIRASHEEAGRTLPFHAGYRLPGLTRAWRHLRAKRPRIFGVSCPPTPLTSSSLRWPVVPIKTIKDLKGKKVAVGAPGSGTEAMARYVLKVYGLTYDDIDEQFLSATESAEAIKDGNIDAVITTLGTPAPALMDLATQRNIRFLDIEPDVAEKINKEFPAYFPTTIPANTYKNQDKPHHTLAWMGLFVVHKDMSEQLAYDILKAVFEHKDELDKIHAQFKGITLENAVKGMPIPWHSGSVKFFKEKGVLK